MNIAITGHRPERITDQDQVCSELLYQFEDLMAYRVIQGMAPGADLLAARTAYRAGIPYVCAKPYPSHRNYVEKNYPTWLYDYDQALENADEVVDVCDSYEGVWVFQKRNEWMVDRGDIVVAVWDGKRKGGTWNAVNYANKIGREVVVIQP